MTTNESESLLLSSGFIAERKERDAMVWLLQTGTDVEVGVYLDGKVNVTFDEDDGGLWISGYAAIFLPGTRGHGERLAELLEARFAVCEKRSSEEIAAAHREAAEFLDKYEKSGSKP